MAICRSFLKFDGLPAPDDGAEHNGGSKPPPCGWHMSFSGGTLRTVEDACPYGPYASVHNVRLPYPIKFFEEGYKFRVAELGGNFLIRKFPCPFPLCDNKEKNNDTLLQTWRT